MQDAQWLIRDGSTKVKAHIWTGVDTMCRMASTGGIKLDRMSIRDARGSHEVCHMCKVNAAKQEAFACVAA
jgi:hypothetical protein